MRDKTGVPINEAVQVLNMGVDLLRAWIQMGTCPFGEYIKPENNERGAYYIHPNRLRIYNEGLDMYSCRRCAHMKDHDPLKDDL